MSRNKSKPKHTPGPWWVDESSRYVGFNGTFTEVSIMDADNLEVAKGMDTPDEANAARIVACVNACEGLADPEKDIPSLLEIARLFIERCNSHGSNVGCGVVNEGKGRNHSPECWAARRIVARAEGRS